LRTVSSLISSTIFSSTSWSASICIVHFANPSGAALQVRATSRASAALPWFRASRRTPGSRRFESFKNTAVPQSRDGIHTDIEGFGDLRIRPRRPIGVGLEQHPNPQSAIPGEPRLIQHHFQLQTLLDRQPHDNFGIRAHRPVPQKT
jgi:hypothetical protein